MGESLLERVAADEPGAVEAFIDQYGGLVWSLARRSCPRPEDAEDAVQEIFLQLWKSASRYDPSIASEVTFVAMIARRRLIDRRRRAGRAAPEDPLPLHLETDGYGARQRIEAGAEVALAGKVLRRLRAREREALLLSTYYGMSHSQIADHTGLPLGTVKTYIRRGLIRVREMLEEGRGSSPGGEG